MNEMTNSHILHDRFDYYEPVSVSEASALLVHYAGRAKVLAGGTDLLVQMKVERSAPEAVISLGRIAGLERIAIQDGQLHIGARATIMAMQHAPQIRAHYPALLQACASFSTTQVQTMGTVGGNLGHGSPASDTAPALLALRAEVEIAGPGGRRRLPLEEFFVGPGKTALQTGELLTEVILPMPAAGTGSAFLKVSRVAADIAKASAAVALVRDGNRIVDACLAFGSVGPTPMRTRAAEQLLAGQSWSEELVSRAAQAASEQVTPIDDVRSEAWYRREMVRVLAYDGLQRAWQSALNGPLEWKEEAHAPKPAETPAAPSLKLDANERRWIELNVNGEKLQAWVAPNDLLLNVIRDQLELTGSKYGCGIGECSACTVQMDGQPVLACLVLAASAVGHEILTVEGLQQPNGELHPLQEAFLDFSAYQCGYCTPGMLLTAKSLLAEEPHPTEGDVRNYLRGNLCRCTGYASIVRAVMSCANGKEA